MPQLVLPARSHLPDYVAALETGWSPDTLRGPDAARQYLTRIVNDPDAFLKVLNLTEPKDETVTLPDGSTVPRLPNLTRWIWSDGFAGQISFRWQPGTMDLPPTCLGHVGYAVVPWKRRRGLATWALGQILPIAAGASLPAIEVTCDPDNTASIRVIEANGGALVERFDAPASLGGGAHLRYRISLPG